MSIREKKCPAWNKECNNCHSKGHFKSRCPKDGVKVNSVNVQERKDIVCSVSITGVVKKKMGVNVRGLHGRKVESTNSTLKN